jgi:hypothetical protein
MGKISALFLFLPGEGLGHEFEPLPGDLHALLRGQVAHRVLQVLLDPLGQLTTFVVPDKNKLFKRYQCCLWFYEGLLFKVNFTFKLYFVILTVLIKYIFVILWLAVYFGNIHILLYFLTVC